MTQQLIEIGLRLSALREIMDISCEKMAELIKIPLEDYMAFEKGEKDFSFGFLYNAANILGVDVLDILSGESPKLSTCCIVRKGEGLDISRRAAYGYKHLAYTFRNKKAEPFLVTVGPSDSIPALNEHDGQEFVYMVSGSMDLILGDTTYTLEENDSIYFNSGIPHAMKALDNQTARFISVVL